VSPFAISKEALCEGSLLLHADCNRHACGWPAGVAPGRAIGAIGTSSRSTSEIRPSKFAGYFLARVVAVLPGQNLNFRGAVLTIVAGENFVVTHHADEIDFLADMRARQPETVCDIGCLGEASFVAALLD